MGGQTLVDLPLLLGDVKVHRRAGLRGSRRDLPQRRFADRAQAVGADRDANASGRTLGRAFLVGQKLRRIHREVPLAGCGIVPVEPGTLVEHRHIAQPDAAGRGGAANGLEHRVRGAGTSRLPVQVVELDD